MPKIPASQQGDNLSPDNSAVPALSQPGQAEGGAAFDADHAARTAQVNEAWVKNAQAGWLDGMNALLYHPDTGYLNQRGGIAVGGYGGLQDAMGKLYRQSTDNLADDTQRGMFQRSTEPLLGAFQAQIRRHAENQCRVFDADASHSRFQSALGLALNAYDPGAGTDNALYRSSAAIAHNELENAFRHTHGDPEAEDNKTLWQHYLQFGPSGDGGMCAIHTGIVNRLLENNQPDHARSYLDGVENALPVPTRDKLDQFIRTGEDRQQAVNAVLQVQAKSEDHGEQQQALDGMRDSGKLNDDAHAIASHSLQAAQQQQLAVQKQNDEQSLARVWGLKQNNPNAALSDLPASTLAYLKSRGLDQNAEAILSGHPATDDPALFNELHRLASEDPVKFAQTSLITSSGHLSKAHMDYLQGLQDAINKQDPQAIAASRQVNDAIATVHTEMHLSGVDPNPQPGSEQAKKLAGVESTLRDQIIAAQQAKSGTPLTRDEVQNLAMGYFADQVLKSGVFGKNGDGKQDGQNMDQGVPQEGKGAQNAGGLKQTNPAEALPQGAPVAASSMEAGGKQDVKGNEEAVSGAKPNSLSLDEFNAYSKVARGLQYRSNQAAKDKKKLVVTSEERKQLMEMQQRLGVRQTGRYDNATRHAFQAAFIEMIRSAAESEEKKNGVPAAVTIGQAILETGYGQHMPSDVKTGQRSNNYFGIKPDKPGQPYVNSMTKEYNKKGQLESKLQPFAVYDNIGGSIQEHSAFLKRNRNYRSLFSGTDPEKWAQGLQDAGYGGRDNKTYADALINTMRKWKLIK